MCINFRQFRLALALALLATPFLLQSGTLNGVDDTDLIAFSSMGRRVQAYGECPSPSLGSWQGLSAIVSRGGFQ